VYLNNVEIASVLSSYAVYCEAGKRAMVTLDITPRSMSLSQNAMTMGNSRTTRRRKTSG
jgi:hypothetical protein